MRRHRVIAVVLLFAALLLAIPMEMITGSVSAAAKNNKQLIYDFAGMLTQAEREELNQLANKYGAERKTDIIIVMTEEDKDTTLILDDFYKQHAPGYGEPYGSSVILILNTTRQDFYFASYGKAQKYVDAVRLDEISKRVSWDIIFEKQMRAFRNYILLVHKYMGIAPGTKLSNNSQKTFMKIAGITREKDKKMIFDTAKVLGPQEYNELNKLAMQYSNERKTDIIIVTIFSLDSYSAKKMANDFYNEYGPGFDKRHGNAVILMADVLQKDIYVAGFNDAMTHLDDEKSDQIRDKITWDISKGNYQSAFKNYLQTTYKHLRVISEPNSKEASSVVAETQKQLPATETKRYIFDHAKLLNNQEYDDLEALAKQFSAERETDMIIYTNNSPNAYDVKKMTQDFYDEYGPGYDKRHGNAVILMVDMTHREVYLAGFYKGKEYLDDDRLDQIREKVTPDLTDKEYKQAFQTYLKTAHKYMGFRPGINPENLLLNIWVQLGAALLIGGGIVTLFVYRSGGRVTVDAQTYEDPNSAGLVDYSDHYIRTCSTRTRRYSSGSGSSSSSGGGGTTSGGHSHSGSRGSF